MIPLDAEDAVLQEIERDDTVSVRQIARRTAISRTTVHSIIQRNLMHPYHVQRVQALLPSDYQQRITFCRRMLRKMERNPNFFNKILWTDESSCRKDGYMNLHNLHHWAVQNPHATRVDRSQTQFKINLWTGIINGQIIGPHVLPATLNGENYLEFLQNDLSELLGEVPLATRQGMWYQNDGCPAHYARNVRQYLNEQFPRRWIGRLGPISWPPRSPDLNPVDFFYWGALKDLVYASSITSIDQLQERINSAAEQINNAGYTRRIKRSFIKRCRMCIRAEGRHFEHLL